MWLIAALGEGKSSYHCFKILDRGGSCFGLVTNSFPVLSSLSQRIVFLLLIPKRKVSQYLTSVGSIFVLLHSYFSFLTGICIDEVNNIMLVGDSDSDNKHLSCFQQGFIAQLVEHRGFMSCWSLRIFLGSICNCLSYFTTARSLSLLFFIRSSPIWSHIHFTSTACFIWWSFLENSSREFQTHDIQSPFHYQRMGRTWLLNMGQRAKNIFR